MGDVEIELWTEDEQSDYARIFGDLNDESAKNLYNHLWNKAIEWIDDQKEDPEIYKRLTGRNVDVADVIDWYEKEGHLKRIEKDGDLVLVPSDSVEEAIRTDASNRTVLYED